MKKPKKEIKPAKKPASTKEYFRKYRKDNPLLTSHVPKPVYEEVKRRATEEKRSINQWLALFLEKALFVKAVE